MIKVGQFLSTRVDMMPVEITEELSGLQDEVPPEDFQKITLVHVRKRQFINEFDHNFIFAPGTETYIVHQYKIDAFLQKI